MRIFRALSLKWKLMSIITLTTAVALLLASAAFLTYEIFTFRHAMIRDTSILAGVVGTNCAASLKFNDPESVRETLSALKTEPHIVAACIFRPSGHVFTCYRRSDLKGDFQPPAPRENQNYFDDNYLNLFQPIFLDHDKIGIVFIRSDLEEEYLRLRRYAGIIAFIILGASLVALLLASRLQQVISGPILHLLQVEERVSKEKDYSVRAMKSTSDEMGVLINGFNEMLSQIQQRDAEVTRARDHVDSIITYMIDSLIVIDASGVIKTVNKAALELLGYSEEELIGQPLAKLLEDEELFFMLRGLIEGGSVREFELIYVSKDGRKIPVSCSGSMVRDEAEGEQGIVCIAKDITERKQAEEALRESEERFRTLFENIPIGMYRTTPDGKILNANPALVAMLGYSSLEELTLRNLEEEGFEPEYSRQEFKRRIEIDGEIKGLEAVWRRKDHALIYVSENAKVIRDAHGKPLYYEGTVEDISERKKIERMKNEFVSIVSHELRVPLTSIRGSLQWMVESFQEQLPERARKMIDIASRSSERMVRLINDMLDIDKIESGKMIFQIRPLELMPLVEQAIEANQSYAEQFHVKFILGKALPGVKVNVDSDRLMQVMTNLMSNAAKFSPPDDVVSVSVFRHSDTIRLAVTDHGPGIPEKFRSRIFQKFAQACTTDPRQKGGTGLGLSISKVIVERLGGQIGFEAQDTAGTTFYFDLPEWQG